MNYRTNDLQSIFFHFGAAYITSRASLIIGYFYLDIPDENVTGVAGVYCVSLGYGLEKRMKQSGLFDMAGRTHRGSNRNAEVKLDYVR